MRPTAQIYFASAILCGACPALAEAPQPGALHLLYQRAEEAEGCPDERGFRDIVAARLNDADPFAGADAERKLLITLRHPPGQPFQAEVAQQDAEGALVGVRRFDGAPTCMVLVEDIATSLTLMLARPPPPPPLPLPPPRGASPERRPSATPLPVAAPEVASNDDAPAPGRLRLQIGGGPSATFATEPAMATAGLSALVGLRWQSASIALEGRGNLPASTSADAKDARADAALFAGSISTCLHHGWVLGCGILTVGLVHGSALGANAGDDRGPRVEAGVRLGGELKLSEQLMAQLTTDLQAVLARAGVVLDQQRTWSSIPMSLTPTLRLVALF